MIIGHPGGLYNPTLATYYLLANGRLMKDTTIPVNAVPDSFNQFNFNLPCTTTLYDSVKDLIATIPAELFSNNYYNYGRAAPVFGYLDVRVWVNGVQYKWYFEENLYSCSAAIQQFATKAYLLFP